MAVAQQFCKSYCENYCFTSGAAAIYSSHLSPNAEETTRYPSKQRLFMTATLKVYTPHLRKRAEESGPSKCAVLKIYPDPVQKSPYLYRSY